MRDLNEEAAPFILWDEKTPRMRPLANERVLCTGKTQSGKSELFSAWIKPAAEHTPTVLIDPKGAKAMRALSDFRIPTGKPQLPSADWYIQQYQQLGRYPVMRYVPDSGLKAGRDDALNDLFWMILEHGNMLIVSDETTTYSSENAYPAGEKACNQLGAEPGIGHWKINQRAKGIPPFYLSSADMIVSFWLGNSQDRIALSAVGVDFEPVVGLDQYEYAVYRHGKDRAITIYPPVPIKKTSKEKKR